MARVCGDTGGALAAVLTVRAELVEAACGREVMHFDEHSANHYLLRCTTNPQVPAKCPRIAAHVVRVAHGDSAPPVTASPLKPSNARNSSKPSVAAFTLESPSISMRCALRLLAINVGSVRVGAKPIAPCAAAVPVMPSIQRNASTPPVTADTLLLASESTEHVVGCRPLIVAPTCFEVTFDSDSAGEKMVFAKRGYTRPVNMFIHGRINGATKDGIYLPKGTGATWELVGSPNENQFGRVSTIGADLLKKNRVYIGTGGRGIFVGVGANVPQGSTRVVNSGGAASGNYQVDAGFTGGSTFVSNSAIDRGTVEQPAPDAVYQSERYGASLTYQSPVLAEGRRYLVRLHFAEIWWGFDGKGGAANGVGMRTFDVSISNRYTPEKKVLTNFDIFKEAGGANKAIVCEFEAVSDGPATSISSLKQAQIHQIATRKLAASRLLNWGFSNVKVPQFCREC